MCEYRNIIIEGDCLEVMKRLPASSINLVLCDLPYGTTQNKWDSIIDLDQLWHQYERIIKPDGVIALTTQGRFTGQVIMSNIKLFKYKIAWIKSKATNFLNANRQPLRKHEDICIFYKKQPVYQPQKTFGKPYNRGYRGDNQSGNYGEYGYYPIINLEGKRHPSDVLFLRPEIADWIFCKVAQGDGTFHPTQKPVDLGRWLIRTYTQPGDLVLDNACGSGSFLVAAVMENREFIGIEKNQHFFHLGRKKVDLIRTCNHRIEAAYERRKLML